MKLRSEIVRMQCRVEREAPLEDRMTLLMALEWVLDQSISTSIGLEDWLQEQAEQFAIAKGKHDAANGNS